MNQSPEFKTAHARAKALMDEPFYFSSIEETAPFGNDDGADTFMGFQRWRASHPSNGPLDYLQAQLHEWDYPPLDFDETDPLAVVAYAKQSEMGIGLLTGTDAAVVALAFAQLYLEGTIDAQLCELTKNAIRRQLHPDLLLLWDSDYRSTREEQLNKMLSVLNRV